VDEDVIVPLFALANAGVHITGGLLSDSGLLADHDRDRRRHVVGKPLGIFWCPGWRSGPRCARWSAAAS